MPRHKRILLNILFLIFQIPGLVWAGNTGKIMGKVVDKTTGEPLAGVNIIIENTTQGAASDLDGTYFIIGIIATVAIRVVTVLTHLDPIYAKVAWYIGVGSFGSFI